jgi:hypothetical protein
MPAIVATTTAAPNSNAHRPPRLARRALVFIATRRRDGC